MNETTMLKVGNYIYITTLSAVDDPRLCKITTTKTGGSDIYNEGVMAGDTEMETRTTIIPLRRYHAMYHCDINLCAIQQVALLEKHIEAKRNGGK